MFIYALTCTKLFIFPSDSSTPLDSAEVREPSPQPTRHISHQEAIRQAIFPNLTPEEEDNDITRITVPIPDLTPSGFQPYSDEFTFHDELNGLLDMGFNDVVINKMLLRQFEGDVNRCVNALLTRGSNCDDTAPFNQQQQARREDGFLA